MQTTLPANMTNEELLERWLQLQVEEEDLKSEMSVLKDELLLRLEDLGLDSMPVQDYTVSKTIRKSWVQVPMEYAAGVGAVETKETLNTKALDALYKKGVEIPGMSSTTFVTIRQNK